MVLLPPEALSTASEQQPGLGLSLMLDLQLFDGSKALLSAVSCAQPMLRGIREKSKLKAVGERG